MSVYEWHAYLVERAAGMLAHFLSVTKSERLDWRPSVDGHMGRDALDQASECIRVNNFIALLLRGEEPTAATDEPAHADRVCAEVLASGENLASAIRGLEDGALERLYPARFGPTPGKVLLELAHANMHYHIGQINYIQSLYGDKDFHVPPGFF